MQCLSRDLFRPDALYKGGIQAGLTLGSFAALLLLMHRNTHVEANSSATQPSRIGSPPLTALNI